MRIVGNRKIFLIIVLVISFSIIISGCSAKKSESLDFAPSDNSTGSQSNDMDYGEDSIHDEEWVEEQGYVQVEPDKIITTVNISMQTKEFDDTVKKLMELISNHKGYIENSNISHNNYINSARLKYSEYTIRVPRENLTQFVDKLKGIGNIISENTSKEDITKQYRDTESRLRVLETKEERILALMEKAEKMEDIIALENQLSNIIYDKENLKANIMEMDDKVDYSTVHFQLDEVAKLSIGENTKAPFITKASNAFKDSLYFFMSNIERLVIGIIYFLPYGLIIVIALFIVLKFIKKVRYHGHRGDSPKE